MRKSKNATVSHTKLFLWYLLFALLVLAFLPVSAGAEEQENTLTLPDEYQDYLDALPDDVADQLPDGILTEDGEALGDAVFEMSSFSYLLQTALSMMGLKLSSAVSTLAEIVGLLLLSALAKAFQKSLKSDGVSRAFSFCASSVMTLCLLSKSYLGLSSVSNYFESLSRMTTASLPLMGALYAMGGNVATAVASTAGLSVYLTVLEGVIAKSILPFCGICMASALVGGLDPSLRIDTAISTVKKKIHHASFLFDDAFDRNAIGTNHHCGTAGRSCHEKRKICRRQLDPRGGGIGWRAFENRWGRRGLSARCGGALGDPSASAHPASNLDRTVFGTLCLAALCLPCRSARLRRRKKAPVGVFFPAWLPHCGGEHRIVGVFDRPCVARQLRVCHRLKNAFF